MAWQMNPLASGDMYAGGPNLSVADWAAKMGFKGNPLQQLAADEHYQAPPTLSQEFLDYAKANGYGFGDQVLNRNDVQSGLFKDGQLIDSVLHRNTLRDTGFNRAVDRYLPVGLAAMGAYGALGGFGGAGAVPDAGTGFADMVAGTNAADWAPAAAGGGGAGGMFPSMAVGPVGENAGAGVLETLGDNLGQFGAVGAPSGGSGTALSSGGGMFDGLGDLLKGGGSWVNVAGNLLGAAINSGAARSAANTQADASRAAIEEQRRMADQARADFAPWRQAGVNALGTLQTEMGAPVTAADVMSDPGYQFGMKSGQQAIDRKIAAGGGRISGAAIKAAGRFGTDYATGGYNAAYQRRQDRLNRLQALAGIGQTATGSSSAAGQNSSNAISNLISSGGDAAGAGRMAQGNIWGNAVNSITANFLRNRGQATDINPLYGLPNYAVDPYGP